MELGDREIHLWAADTKDFPLQQLESHSLAWLSAAELAKFNRFKVQQSRHEFLLGQALLRTVLSEYMPGKPQDWKFSLQQNGKPTLAQAEEHRSVGFNLSHSDGRVILAVGRSEQIGVDLEKVREQRRISKIAERHFSPAEVEQFQKLSGAAQLNRFYELWTLKESYIKATGKGLSQSLSSFGFEFTTDSFEFWLQDGDRDEATRWQFWQLEAGETFRLALGCHAGLGRVQQLRSFAWLEFTGHHEIATEVIRSF